jgi:Protein of unknown function (DUF5672)
MLAILCARASRELPISLTFSFNLCDETVCLSFPKRQQHTANSFLCIMPKSSSAKLWKTLSILLLSLVLIQWFLLLSMLQEHHSNQGEADSHPEKDHFLLQQQQLFVAQTATRRTIEMAVESNIWNKKDYGGVAITVMLKAPKWFHRRFTFMLHNAMANIPSNWPIQVFSNEAWLHKDVLPYHPGLQRLRTHPRLIWTPLPTELTKTKPKEIMKSKWLWNHVVADNVMVFTGNGAFCANSKSDMEDFLDYDYVGVPWGRYYGQGGDGSSHSFRKKSAMLRILKDHSPEFEMDTPDFQFFVKYLLNDKEHFKIADKNTTYAFGGIRDPESSPLVISGTQAQLNWTSRDALLGVCPELKVIFPSLHEPSCFGAHPDGEICKKTICALQNELPASGC